MASSMSTTSINNISSTGSEWSYEHRTRVRPLPTTQRRASLNFDRDSQLYSCKSIGEAHALPRHWKFSRHLGPRSGDRGSLLAYYTMCLKDQVGYTYEPQHGTCAVEGCRYKLNWHSAAKTPALEGGLVLLEKSQDCWLVPLCRMHNNPDRRGTFELAEGVLAVRLYSARKRSLKYTLYNAVYFSNTRQQPL